MIASYLVNKDIPRENAACMQEYGQMVLDANAQFNLTRIIAPDEMAERHFYDALIPSIEGKIIVGAKLLDIGTGAGFPGVPLSIFRPDIEVTLLDASEKKMAFIGDACGSLGIPVTTLTGRAEELAREPAHCERYDVVTARAVAALPILLELVCAFLKVGGIFIAYKGDSAPEEILAAKHAANLLALEHVDTISQEIAGQIHYYIVYRKNKETPRTYPRRYAKIKKQPL